MAVIFNKEPLSQYRRERENVPVGRLEVFLVARTQTAAKHRNKVKVFSVSQLGDRQLFLNTSR